MVDDGRVVVVEEGRAAVVLVARVVVVDGARVVEVEAVVADDEVELDDVAEVGPTRPGAPWSASTSAAACSTPQPLASS